MRSLLICALCLGLLGTAACSSSNDETKEPGADAGGGDAGQLAICTTPTAVPCSDQVIQEMNLRPDPAPGLISSQADGSGWLSLIDATAGGPFVTNPDSYVYARFADTGLEKVDLSDDSALDSMDWDIAFRRYVVRVNSGHSGPSCVAAARLPGTPDYDGITAVPPDNLTYRPDEYFTVSCELIPDGSGLPNSPATALSSYWKYPGCVSMTGNVFIVRVASGRRLKLTVTDYYEQSVQQTCNTTGAVPQGSISANFRVRWAWLE